MWDLIASVPDHCLSFYFERCQIIALLRMTIYNCNTVFVSLRIHCKPSSKEV